MTTKTEFVHQIIYDIIANLMPSLGRDFTVDLNVTDEDALGRHVPTSIKIKALTRMGEAVTPIIAEGLNQVITKMNSKEEFDKAYQAIQQEENNAKAEFMNSLKSVSLK